MQHKIKTTQLIATMLLLLLLGCGRQNALEARKEELRYDANSIERDLTRRLKLVGSKSSNRASARGDRVQEIERGREVEAEGGRPDPNSMESIVMEFNAKLASVSTSDKVSFLEEVLGKLRAAGEVNSKTIEEFSKAMRVSLGVK